MAQDAVTLSLYPRSHLYHTIGVYILAMARFARCSLSQQKEDLDKSIVHYTEAIFLPPVSRTGLNVVQLLFRLSFALLVRSEKFKQPHDIKYSIEYLRYLRGLPLGSFDLPRNTVTSSLIRALGIRVESEAGDGTRNIKEMVVLCRELLTSNISAGFPVAAFMSLNEAVNAEFDRGRPVQSLDEAIQFLRDAVRMYPPGSHLVLYALADTLRTRFVETHSNDDYEGAMALIERILDPNEPGDCPDWIRDFASSLTVELVYARSTIFPNPEYSEVSISRLRTFLSSSSDEEIRPQFTDMLSTQARERFKEYSLAESLKKRTPILHNWSTFHPLKARKNLGCLFLDQTLFGSYIRRLGWRRKFSILKNCSQLLLPGPNVTKIASVTLQFGMNQSSAVPTIYRISKSPSSMADCQSMRLVIPVT